MQGGWISQHMYSWKCVDSNCEGHAAGPVQMWRPNPNGTNRLMTRTETLCNRTMFLIGRIPLDTEHLLIWQLYRQFKTLPRELSIPGCINDCLFVKGASEEDLQQLCADLTAGVDKSPKFKLKDELGDAPLLEWRYSSNPPRFSAWRRKESTEKLVEAIGMEEDHNYLYGSWSFNGGFKYDRE